MLWIIGKKKSWKTVLGIDHLVGIPARSPPSGCTKRIHEEFFCDIGYLYGIEQFGVFQTRWGWGFLASRMERLMKPLKSFAPYPPEPISEKWGPPNVPDVFKTWFTFPGDCREFLDFIETFMSSWGWLWRKREIIRICCLAHQKSNLKENINTRCRKKGVLERNKSWHPSVVKKSHWF